MERIFLFNFADDGEYNGLELQRFNHPTKGTGFSALMWRTDGKVDFYMTPGLRLERDKAQVGNGVGEWITQEFDCHLERGPQGTDCACAFTLKDGRPVRMMVREHLRHPGNALTILAPMGEGIRAPRFFPFFWLKDIDLVRVASTDVHLSIGARPVKPMRLPMPMPHTFAFAYFMRFCPDPLMILFNPQSEGSLSPVMPDITTGFAHDGMLYDLAPHDGHYEMARAYVLSAGHEVSLRFSPPVPALLDLQEGAGRSGRFELGVEAMPAIVGGSYSVRRSGDQVRMDMAPTDEWKPHGTFWQRLTLWLFPAVFRTWPKTYAWSAALSTAGAGKAVRAASHWQRTGPKPTASGA